MRPARAGVVLLLLLAVATAPACRPRLVVRLTTQAYHDGSLERRLELTGRGPDGEVPEGDDWLAERAGVRLARPEAWRSVEHGAGRLTAEGFFLDADVLPPLLTFELAAAERPSRSRTTLDVDDRVLLVRWSYAEHHADPFSREETAAALDALVERAIEALRHEVRAQLGEEVDTAAAERFVRGELRSLVLALLTVSRSAAGWERTAERAERWSAVLAQRAIPVAAADPHDYWDAQVPAILAWAREGVAAALSTPELPVAPAALGFWPAGDDWAEQAAALVARVWDSPDELYEAIAPQLTALSGYFASDEAPWYRFEIRARLPGVLWTTNGTPDGDSVLWLLRERDLTLGEVVLRADSIELQTEPLVALDARRELTAAQLVRLADLLFRRDPAGDLVPILADAVAQGRLDPLRDENRVPERLLFVASELADLLDPAVPLD